MADENTNLGTELNDYLAGERLIDEFEDDLIARLGRAESERILSEFVQDGYDPCDSPELIELLIEAIRFGQRIARDLTVETEDPADEWKPDPMDLAWPKDGFEVVESLQLLSTLTNPVSSILVHGKPGSAGRSPWTQTLDRYSGWLNQIQSEIDRLSDQLRSGHDQLLTDLNRLVDRFGADPYQRKVMTETALKVLKDLPSNVSIRNPTSD